MIWLIHCINLFTINWLFCCPGRAIFKKKNFWDLETSNPRSTKPRFLKDTKVISIKVHIGVFLEDWKSNFCHSAAKKCCGSENLLICLSVICSISILLSVTAPIWTKHLDPILVDLNFCRTHIFGLNVFWPNLFFIPNSFGPKFFWNHNFFDSNFLLT